jgi:hypothetical protein
MVLIECSALFAAMNRKITAGSHRLGENGRGFSEDLPLFGERVDLAAQPAQLLALAGCSSFVASHPRPTVSCRSWPNVNQPLKLSSMHPLDGNSSIGGCCDLRRAPPAGAGSGVVDAKMRRGAARVVADVWAAEGAGVEVHVVRGDLGHQRAERGGEASEHGPGLSFSRAGRGGRSAPRSGGSRSCWTADVRPGRVEQGGIAAA